MNKNNFIIIVSSFILFVGLNSCGDTAEEDLQTGVFVSNAIVIGLQYSTPTRTRTTDSEGKYYYLEDENITFTLGNLDLAEVKAQSIITPLTLGANQALTNISQKSINIARIIKSLDSQYYGDKIILPSAIQALDIQEFDITQENDLYRIIDAANYLFSTIYILKDEADTLSYMITFLETYLYDGNYTGDIVYNSTKSETSSSECSIVNATWDMSIDDTVTLNTSTPSYPSSITFVNSTLKAIMSDDYTLMATIDELGNINGTYAYENCINDITGTKN